MNITLSADAKLIALAQTRAASENTTLEAVFGEWLERYVRPTEAEERFDRLYSRLDTVNSGRKSTRDDANGR